MIDLIANKTDEALNYYQANSKIPVEYDGVKGLIEEGLYSKLAHYEGTGLFNKEQLTRSIDIDVINNADYGESLNFINNALINRGLDDKLRKALKLKAHEDLVYTRILIHCKEWLGMKKGKVLTRLYQNCLRDYIKPIEKELEELKESFISNLLRSYPARIRKEYLLVDKEVTYEDYAKDLGGKHQGIKRFKKYDKVINSLYARIKTLKSRLHKFNIYIKLAYDELHPEGHKEPSFEGWLCSFIELTQKARDTMSISVSIDPMRNLFPNAEIGNTSCFDVSNRDGNRNSTGLYYNSVLSFYLHPNSLLLEIFDKTGKKVARQWVFYNKDTGIGFFLPLYGIRNNGWLRDIRKGFYKVVGLNTDTISVGKSICVNDVICKRNFESWLDESTCYFRDKTNSKSDKNLDWSEYFEDLKEPICISCGHEVVEGSSGGTCKDCSDSCICYECGETIDNNDRYERDGNCYCETCYNDLFGVCDYCEEAYEREDMTCVNSTGEYVCESCLNDHFIYCDDCETYHRDEDMLPTNIGTNICEGCSYDYSRCEECGVVLIDLEDAYDDKEGYCYCGNCYEEEEEEEEEEEVA